MNNLPISSNSPQLSGNAAASIAIGNPAMDAQLAEPFAFLLAQQIGEACLPAPNAAQITIAMDGSAKEGGTDPATKDAQDTAAAANAPGDPANVLAAILQQLSAPEDKGQKAEGMQATPSFTPSHSQKMEGGQATPSFTPSYSQKMEGGQATQPLTLAPPRKTEDPQAMQPLAPVSSQGAEQKTPIAGPENSHMALQATVPGPAEAVSGVELPSGPAQPAPNTAQAIAPPVTPPAIPETASAADATPTIATPFGNNGWADEFSQKIRWIATQQNQVAELHLNPPNLGPLDVVLKISDNQATALFASPHGAVRDAVENALPKLREILADNGIMLGNTTISDQSPRDRSMDGFMNQGFGTARQHEAPSIASEPAGSSPAAMQAVPVRRHNGMVDTFA